MRIIADFHIHSKYSRATSKDMDIPHLAQWAKLKGIGLMGTGDFTHPLWLHELKRLLKPSSAADGLYEYDNVNFILTAEVCNIFSVKGQARRIHNVIIAPSFEAVEKINKELGYIGNLEADGRPIFGLAAEELVKIALAASPDCMIIPGHCWTPWFGIFGAASGFDTVEECFGKEAKNIYCLETGLSCYDEKTDVLTEGGWKKFSTLRYPDKICTLNTETGMIEFHKPSRIIINKYKGKMYKLKTKRVNLLVTPNHKLFYSPCDFRNRKPYRLKEAEFLFNKSKIFKKDGAWLGSNPMHFVLPEVKVKHGSRHYSGHRTEKEKHIPVKPWLRFFGFWVAEGWTSEGKDGDYNVCICNQDQSLLDEMEQILKSFGYNIFRGDNIIRVRNFQLFSYLRKFGKCYNKFIPLEVKALSKELLEIFLEYYIKGDGHIYGRNQKGLSATTTSIRLRDDLQEIALKIGMSAYYKIGYKKGRNFVSPGCKKIYKQKNDSWVIYFIRRNRPIVLPSTIKKYNYIESWINYNGFVYCATVPNHVMYIRREGVPLWCGNSDPAMNWRLSRLDKYSLISNSDSHSPQKIGREANVFDCEMSYKEITTALKTKDRSKFLYTVEFFPQEGKYHWDGHRVCNVRMSPAETKKNNFKCPRCGKPVTVGVESRVEKLADRPEGFVPDNSIPFKSMIPLLEIIAEARGRASTSQGVQDEHLSIIKRFVSEFNILFDMPKEELEASLPQPIADAVMRVRSGKVHIVPGYDGVYGEVKIFGEGEASQQKEKQMELF